LYEVQHSSISKARSFSSWREVLKNMYNQQYCPVRTEANPFAARKHGLQVKLANSVFLLFSSRVNARSSAFVCILY
jgi:hypothetical protein